MALNDILASLNKFEQPSDEDQQVLPTTPSTDSLSQQAMKLQIPGNITGLRPAALGETVTNQGPPVPSASDFAAHLTGQSPAGSNNGIVIAPDTATNERNANMELYGTSFPTQADRNRAALGGGGGRGRYSAANELLAQHRDAREEMASHLAVIKEATALHQQALADHDTHGFLSELHGLDLNGPNYERDLALLHGKYPNSNPQHLGQVLGAMEKARGNVLRAQEAGGGNQFEEGSHARQDYNDMLKNGGNVFEAVAKAKSTQAAEGRLQKYYEQGHLTPEDFGTADTWQQSGLFHDNGRPNWQAIDARAAKNAREQVTPAQAKLATSQNATFDKRGYDALSPEEQTTYKANQIISRRYSKQLAGKAGAAAPTDLRAGLEVPTSKPVASGLTPPELTPALEDNNRF